MSLIIRSAELADSQKVHSLSGFLDSMNLPDNTPSLNELVGTSMESFSGQIENRYDREYVFVLEDTETKGVIGTSQIIAQHGNGEFPHVFYEVRVDERYSQSVHRFFQHKVLQLGFDFNGPTEVGGLVLDPKYRSHPAKLGKFLSLARFVFIAMHQELFKPRILAELMPPLKSDGSSVLLEAIGRKFTGLDYKEADFISRKNKEFIKALFPEIPIYASLLGENVTKVIGVVGEKTTGAQKLLENVGFSYLNKVDPFDGGPHYGAATSEIIAVKNTKACTLKIAKTTSLPSKGIVGIFHNPLSADARFNAICTEISAEPDSNEVNISQISAELLQAEKGQQVYVLDLAAL